MNACWIKGQFRITRMDTEGCAESSLTGSVLCDWFVTAESQVRSQTIPFVICGGQNGNGTRFFRVLRFSTVIVIPPVLHTHSFVTDTVASNLGTSLFTSQYSYITQHSAVVARKLQHSSQLRLACYAADIV